MTASNNFHKTGSRKGLVTLDSEQAEMIRSEAANNIPNLKIRMQEVIDALKDNLSPAWREHYNYEKSIVLEKIKWAKVRLNAKKGDTFECHTGFANCWYLNNVEC